MSTVEPRLREERDEGDTKRLGIRSQLQRRAGRVCTCMMCMCI